MYNKLNAVNAFIFRIVHIDNVSWILDNGMHCNASETQATDYRVIGNKDLNDPSKFERYQAEALIYKHLPVEAFLGLVCYTSKEKSLLMKMVEKRTLNLSIYSRQGWFFND